MAPSLSEEERKKRFGASLDDRHRALVASGVQHCFTHWVSQGGAMQGTGYFPSNMHTMADLIEGENWLDMMYGFFKETYEELTGDMSSTTGLCVDIDGKVAAIRNVSEKTTVSLARGVSDYAPVPRHQMRILQEGDRVKVQHDGGWMCSKSDVVLTYHQKPFDENNAPICAFERCGCIGGGANDGLVECSCSLCKSDDSGDDNKKKFYCGLLCYKEHVAKARKAGATGFAGKKLDNRAPWEKLVGGEGQPTPFCGFCKAVGGHLKTCTGCSSVRYCNGHCQKKDRKAHKSQCKKWCN